MRELFRETFAGRTINVLSGGRLLSPPETQIPKLHSEKEGLERTSTRRSSTMAESNAAAEMEILEKGQTGHLVDWSGPDDPENPQNWSFGKKLFVTGLICFLTFSIYVGSAIYVSAGEGVQETFHVSGTVSVLGLSVFVFGYGVGPMILAPFSEAPPIGRMPVYILTLLAFIGFNFGVVYAKNIGMLLAFRFLTGFIGSPVLATGGASLADIWSPRKRAYAIGIWGTFAICGPVIGPIVSGFAVEDKGWRWAIWELIWLNGFTFVLLFFTLPETSSDNILFRRAQRIRQSTSNDLYKSAAEIEMEQTPVKEIVVASLVRPFVLCFTEPILIAQNLYLGLIYALLYCWFEAFPLVFGGIYHWNLGIQGLAYIGILVGAIVITIPYFVWIRLKQEPLFDQDGTVAPEQRLAPAVVGSFFLPVCLFWFGWSSRESVHWIMPIIGSAIFPMGAALLFNALLNYQGDAYPKYVGSVLAGNDFARSMFGGSFPIFATAMFNTLGIDWGCSLLGFLSILFIPLPILIQRYGYRLRQGSKNARHDI